MEPSSYSCVQSLELLSNQISQVPTNDQHQRLLITKDEHRKTFSNKSTKTIPTNLHHSYPPLAKSSQPLLIQPLVSSDQHSSSTAGKKFIITAGKITLQSTSTTRIQATPSVSTNDFASDDTRSHTSCSSSSSMSSSQTTMHNKENINTVNTSSPHISQLSERIKMTKVQAISRPPSHIKNVLDYRFWSPSIR